ncbi:hypothetical protein K504DRAFT_459840 [Pleomassaria siparia CBS 279.74]|uniref:LysR family regulatory protein n=1 Tax=Pleomassaria siparia CBS 279.74 TaxID=1314801 RepID=A0A6G1K023_9PLEO|nr:hypothetical protein K504DRAFT_459840 [Pleomassaria siparia CBS 279.74]
MAFLLTWMKSKPVPPERVATDTVFPLHTLDDTNIARSVTLHLSLRYDDVLDVDKLGGALQRLLEKPGWRKLGARLRRGEGGKLEYHMPAKYTKERPAIDLSHVSHDMPMAEHAQGCKLPRSSGSIQMSKNASLYRTLLVSDDSPTQLDDWLYSDRPQLHLHVVSFTDATLVTVTWLHVLFDIMGAGILLSAWTAMLEGREDDVPEFHGFDSDPLATLGAPIDETQLGDASQVEEYVYENRVVSGWKMLRWVLGFMWELLVYRQEETRCVVLPAALFKKLKSEALEELSSIDPMAMVTDKSNRPFLSDGDVLCAFLTRLIVSSQPWLPSARPTKTIQVMNIFGMRPLLTETSPKLLPKGVAYVANCSTSISSFFPLHEFLSLPLGHVAARIRSDLVVQSTRPQIDANMRLSRATMAKTGGHPPLYGDADMLLASFTNWTKSKLFETDFKGAVIVTSGKAEGGHVVGKPTAIFGDATTKGFSVRNSGNCVGRDQDGNWWLGACLRAETWRNLERALDGIR